MASVFPCFFCFSFLLLISLIASVSSSSTITLSLSPIAHSLSSYNSRDYISHIAKITLERVYHLKHPHKQSSVLHGSTKTPLFPKSYGGYSVSLAFGTPPQKIPLVFDTGSSLVWVPCTKSYTCDNCTFSGINPKKIDTFKLRRSSTFRIVDCRSPKCGWLYGSDIQARCPGSKPQSCPTYLMQYGLGSTSGRPITENLDLPGNFVVPDFFLGCSVYSVQQPQGIAGFGRAPMSLPNQLKLRKFSYCLLSHDFDDKPRSSPLTLIGTKSSGVAKVHGVKYTPLLKNPLKSPYDEYYYIHLTKITVGKSRTQVKLPSDFLVPSPNGNGGTIVDSGSTFTFMDPALYGPLIKEMAAQTRHYKRVPDVEVQSGFGLCYDISNSTKEVRFPELVFYFKGGAKMELLVANYFSFMTDLGVWCLTIISESSPAGPSVPVGPAVILGNYQQQNFYLEYDLQHQRLGFKQQKCE